MGQLTDLLEARKKELFFYSPYNFIREFDEQKQLDTCVFPIIRSFVNSPSNHIYEISADGYLHQFYVSHLDWDSNYFGTKTIKLQFVLFEHKDQKILHHAVRLFLSRISDEKTYCFAEIPSEDIMLLQALSGNAFSLIETRLVYFRGKLEEYKHERFSVRKATADDADNLMKVARQMRNDYDRFHADPFFTTKLADDFLATYLGESLNGYADVVLTPDEENLPADSFAVARYQKDEWEKTGVKASKILLTAVSSATNKGWHKKLVSELTYHLKDIDAEYVYMPTQSTNRAVFRTMEKLGFQLGSASHVLSFNIR